MSDVDFGPEIEQAGLMQELLQFTQTPRTIYEIAEHFDWHPQTAREKVWVLKSMGKIRECVRKRARQKLWQTVGSLGNLGEVIIVTSTQSVPMSSFLQVNENRRALGNTMAQALCYLWRRAYYRRQDQDNVLNVAKQGALDPLLDVKKVLMKIYLQHKVYLEAMERMLTEMPELWQDDNPAILDMLGKVERAIVEDNVGDFEAYVTWLLSQQG